MEWKKNRRSDVMNPPFAGFVLDASKCIKLSIEKKREIVRELVKWPQSAPEKLQTWSRRDLLEVLCVEMGKERKYTGLTKQKLIESIFRILSDKKSDVHAEGTGSTPRPIPINSPIPVKRQRKNDHPLRLPISSNNLSASDECEAPKSTHFCLNVACRASLGKGDPFCKRCSCCICQKYDDNKDPSLWLFCSSEDLSQGDSCSLSCHLHCAMKDERTGLAKSDRCSQLDGSYYCIYCGRVNDLLRCWRKQMIIAKDTRRVDVLCHRVSLSHKLLRSSTKYQQLHEIVDEAMKKLENEVGSLNGLPHIGRGIVNRLSVGAEVQRLCVRAVDELDAMPSSFSANEVGTPSSSFIKFEHNSPSSLTLVMDLEDDCPLSQDLKGYTLWGRTVNLIDYPAEPTGTLYKPNRRFLVTGLIPCTEYIFKVAAFSDARELGKWEVGVTTEAADKDVNMSSVAEGNSPKTNSSGLSNPSSEGYESHHTGPYAGLNKSPSYCFAYGEKPDVMHLEKSSVQIPSAKEGDLEETPGLSESALDEDPSSTINISRPGSVNSDWEIQNLDVQRSENESKSPAGNEIVIAPSFPVTPYRLETGQAISSIGLLLESGPSKPEKEPGSSSKKRSRKCDEICKQDGPVEGVNEYCVKMIRWLECKGHIESNFRVKFLTWFSLRATLQERRVVRVYVDTLIDDPGSLAGQLVDTFSDAICGKGSLPTPTGFCMRLWN